MRKKFEELLKEHGPVFMVIYFSIFGLVLAGFTLAIRMGFRPEGTAASVGTFGVAYAATKLTQPLRILASAVLTPIVGRVVKRLRGRGEAKA